MKLIEVPAIRTTPAYYNLLLLGLPARKAANHRLLGIWRSMMRRCYSPADTKYSTHGGAGVTVHPDWHHYPTFERDVVELEGYALLGVMLDKDYYSSKQYSKRTCLWLSPKENATYATHVRPIMFGGLAHLSISLAFEATGISPATIRTELARGRASYIVPEHPLRAASRFTS